MSNQKTMTARESVKLNVEQNRTMFGKASGTFTAHLGETGWSARGTCKEGAIQTLAWELTQARKNEYTRRYIRIPGATFALYWAGAGWCYDIIHDDYASGYVGSCSMSSAKTLDDAFTEMARHADQMRRDAVAVA
jgi:hypothetical protein